MLHLTSLFPPEVECAWLETPPGMAHWAASGPQGARCMECSHFGLKTGSKLESAVCHKYTELMRRKGKKVPKWTPACRHFEDRLGHYAWRLIRSPRVLLSGVLKWTLDPIPKRCSSFSTTFSVT